VCVGVCVCVCGWLWIPDRLLVADTVTAVYPVSAHVGAVVQGRVPGACGCVAVNRSDVWLCD
jgi:hypothetical protein